MVKKDDRLFLECSDVFQKKIIIQNSAAITEKCRPIFSYSYVNIAENGTIRVSTPLFSASKKTIEPF